MNPFCFILGTVGCSAQGVGFSQAKRGKPKLSVMTLRPLIFTHIKLQDRADAKRGNPAGCRAIAQRVQSGSRTNDRQNPNPLR